MSTARLTLLLALLGCVPDVDRRGRDQLDAGEDVSTPDATCASPRTFYADADKDGHGDPSSIISACERPDNAVETDDDCNDTSADIHPGATEVCDGVDNDCSGATAEACPAGCTAVVRPDDQRLYLFCATPASWTNARTQCTSAGMRLVQIDSAAENAFVRQEATARFGAVEIHIGATDAAQENTWRWDGGDLFWNGDEGGAPAAGKFAAWKAGDEPNGTDDCAEMRADAAWYDNDCDDAQRFVCRK